MTEDVWRQCLKFGRVRSFGREMIRLFRHWWRKVVRCLGRVLGGDRTSQSTKTEMSRTEMNPLSDRAYESLYFSLLDLSLPEQTDAKTTVSREQILERLGDRGNDKSFVSWLRRFGRERLKRPSAHRDLAKRMVAFGRLDFGQVSVVSKELGEQLLEKADEIPLEVSSEDNTQQEKSLSECKKASSTNDEELATFYFQQGNDAYFRGDFSGALAAYDQVLHFNPDWHEALSNKGATLTNLGRYEEAIAAYDQVLHFNPDWHEALYNKGIALENLGRYEEAIAAYDQALHFKPDKHEALYNKGVALGNLGRYEEAIAAYDQALHFNPDKHEALSNKGVALGNLGRYEEAIAAYDQALHFKPDKHEALYNKGIALGNLGRYEEAIAAYDQALHFKPDKHEALYSKGIALGNLGRYEEAITAYDQALHFKPGFHEALSNKGVALGELGQYEEAIAAYDQALHVKPDLHEALSNKGVALEKLGRYEEAIAAYDQALHFKPDFHKALYSKGTALENLDRYEEAIAAYDQALHVKPDLHEALSNKGVALGELGQYEEAIVAYDQALHVKPDLHEALSNKGIALYNLGQYEEAIAAYDQALHVKPDFHKAWLNRGVTVGNTVETAVIQYSAITLQHPSLRKRAYEGAQASHTIGLSYVPKSVNPEGYGLFHHYIGRSHYLHGRFLPDADFYLTKAAKSYREALTTLTATDFPEPHLEVLADTIRTHLGLKNADIVKAHREQGLKVLRSLLNNAKTDREKQRIEQKFSGFSQIQIDTLIREDNITAALEAAERYKNRTISWILDNWKEQITSPSWGEIQTLLSPHTVIIYWHLSPDTLTTFLLTTESTEPRVISLTSAEPLNTWIKDWQQRYQTYRKKDKPAIEEIANNEITDRDRPNHPWRLSLESDLQALREILEIEKLEQHLNAHTHLLLVPHRQLHQLPLHALFNRAFITTHLPSLQTALTLKQKQSTQSKSHLLPALLPETPENETLEPLIFAEVETALITHLCQQQSTPPTTLSSHQTHTQPLTTSLSHPHRLFHFTGHAAHNYRHPKNSALALTGTDTLTANEIANLSLAPYDLVTLAACETAVAGQVNLDTDYVGLASAFLTAGATQVISTLWTVDSESNTWLMVKFYQQYLTGTPAPVALHQSQQWLRTVTHEELADWLDSLNTEPFRQSCQNGEDETLTDTIGKHRIAAQNSPASTPTSGQTAQTPYANPYYWAAFTLTGYCHEGQ